MRMNTVAAKGLLTIALCALGGAAQAHVGHEGGHAATFVSGLAHPVSGLDHLLAMVAVGLWSAVALPQRRWQKDRQNWRMALRARECRAPHPPQRQSPACRPTAIATRCAALR